MTTTTIATTTIIVHKTPEAQDVLHLELLLG